MPVPGPPQTTQVCGSAGLRSQDRTSDVSHSRPERPLLRSAASLGVSVGTGSAPVIVATSPLSLLASGSSMAEKSSRILPESQVPNASSPLPISSLQPDRLSHWVRATVGGIDSSPSGETSTGHTLLWESHCP